jgi:hypothetical protein
MSTPFPRPLSDTHPLPLVETPELFTVILDPHNPILDAAIYDFYKFTVPYDSRYTVKLVIIVLNIS